jgi:hypothetical protein
MDLLFTTLLLKKRSFWLIRHWGRLPNREERVSYIVSMVLLGIGKLLQMSF